MLEAWRAEQNLSFQQALNSALRCGLNELLRVKAREPFRTKPVDMGSCRLTNLDNTWEVLEALERAESTRP